MLDYSKLQNGSDIRGVALAGDEEVNLGREEAARLSAAFAEWLSEKLKKPISRLKISVGHDSRLTAEVLKSAALESMCRQGVTALDCGLASSPVMFLSLIHI
mgnify:FL=1